MSRREERRNWRGKGGDGRIDLEQQCLFCIKVNARRPRNNQLRFMSLFGFMPSSSSVSKKKPYNVTARDALLAFHSFILLAV
jgi:hypothetical protein